MKSKKIQEWHLAPELLQKISSGNGDLELVLADYVKKTDIIDKSQLNDNCFSGIIQQLQSIRDAYRKKDDKITTEDIDDTFKNLLDTLQDNVEAIQSATGYTKEEINDLIQACFAENGIAEAKIREKIPGIIEQITTDLQPELDAVIQKVNVSNERVTALAQTVESNRQLANNLYRSRTEQITQEDLDSDLVNTLKNVNEDINELQDQIKSIEAEQLNISGAKNQIVLMNGTGGLSAVDVVEQIEVATTSDELTVALAQLKTPILSIVAPQAIYSIDLPAWNVNAKIVPEETKNIPKIPEPEPVYYHVTYQYVSSDDKPLSETIQNTLPINGNGYQPGEEIAPEEPSVTVITEADGTWSFVGWNPQDAVVEDTNIQFTGTWNFEPYVAPITYQVKYEYYNADTQSQLPIPDTVLETLPSIETDKLSGYYAVPVNPYQTFIFDGDQLWQFTGWNEESIKIEESDITFFGGWKPVVIEEGNTDYEIYRHTYSVSYQYNGTLPEEVLNTLPATTKGHTNGTTIQPEELKTTKVQINNKIWTFVGWDDNNKEINNSDIVFVGTWAYSELPYYSVNYAYIGKRANALEEETIDLPESVTNTLPATKPNNLPGTDVFPVSPSIIEIHVTNGTWAFDGWDKSFDVINDHDITFTGTWLFEEEEPETLKPAYEPSTYTDYTLTANQVKTERISVTIDSDRIEGTNNSNTDTAIVCIGFYGTRVKLYTSLMDVEQTISLSIDNINYSVFLPSSTIFVDDQGHFCFFCIEGLSEGPHRICISVGPGKSLKIDNKICIDDGNHAGILFADDIPDKTFYSTDLYDTGKYIDVLAGNYAFTSSNAVHSINEDDYQKTDFETTKSGYERRLLYSPITEKLFYMTDKGILILLSQSYDAKLAMLEARIAALEG